MTNISSSRAKPAPPKTSISSKTYDISVIEDDTMLALPQCPTDCIIAKAIRRTLGFETMVYWCPRGTSKRATLAIVRMMDNQLCFHAAVLPRSIASKVRQFDMKGYIPMPLPTFRIEVFQFRNETDRDIYVQEVWNSC